MKKQILVFFVTVMMSLMLTGQVMAEEAVVLTQKYFENIYPELSGSNYILGEDVILNEDLILTGENIVIDLNGHTIEYLDAIYSGIKVRTVSATIKDSTGTGSIKGGANTWKLINYEGRYSENGEVNKLGYLTLDSINVYGTIDNDYYSPDVLTIKNSKIYAASEADIENDIKGVNINRGKLIVENSYLYTGVHIAGEINFISGQIGDFDHISTSLTMSHDKPMDSIPYNEVIATFGTPEGKDSDVVVVGNHYGMHWDFDELVINHLTFGNDGEIKQNSGVDMTILNPNKCKINSMTYYGYECRTRICAKDTDYSTYDEANDKSKILMNKSETEKFLKNLLSGKRVKGRFTYHDYENESQFVNFGRCGLGYVPAETRGKAFIIGGSEGDYFESFDYDEGGSSNPNPPKQEDTTQEKSIIIKSVSGNEAVLPTELIKGEDGKYSLSYGKKTKIKLPNKKVMLRTGYEFAGWVDQTNNKIKVLNAKNIGGIESLEATWKANAYKVKYKLVYPAKGYKASEKVVDKTKYLYDSGIVTIMGNGVTASSKLDGAPVYKLVGWTTDYAKAAAGTAECEYGVGTTGYKNLAGDIKKNKTITLYPVWEKQ